eukprot:5687320-Amphidinium_carterae.1
MQEEYVQEWGEKKAKVLGCKHGKLTSAAKKHVLKGVKVHLRTVPAKEISVDDAKKMVSLGGSIWQEKRDSFQVLYQF